MTNENTTRRLTRALPWLLGVVLLALVVGRAWISDDAYITLRTARNFVEGHGLRYNVDERVQAFTHPLWLLLCIPLELLGGNVAFWSMGLSILTGCLATALVCRRVLVGSAERCSFLMALACSPSFVDYTSGGLENSLTHLLLACVLSVSFRQDERLAVRPLAWLTALLYLSRPDAILFGALPLAYATMTALRQGTPARSLARALVVGLAPALVWTVFSLVYYGTPFPNTAYAKLGGGLPAAQIWAQGFSYFVYQWRFDPASWLILAAGIASGVARKGRAAALSLTIVLYLLYVARVGGDHMGGRFFSSLVFLAAALLAQSIRLTGWRARAAWGVQALAFLVAVAMGRFPWGEPARVELNRIADERLDYREATLRFWLAHPDRPFPDHEFARVGREWAANAAPHGRWLKTGGAAGMKAYLAGPELHYVDFMALTDPFLSRLPAAQTERWRIGHLRRRLPQGYLASLREQRNRIVEPHLSELWEDVHRATTGALWTRARWASIARLATMRLPFPCPSCELPGELGAMRLADAPVDDWRVDLRPGEYAWAESARPLSGTHLVIDANRSAQVTVTLRWQGGRELSLPLGLKRGQRVLALPTSERDRGLRFAAVRTVSVPGQEAVRIRGIWVQSASRPAADSSTLPESPGGPEAPSESSD